MFELNIRHVVGMFLIGQILLFLGRLRANQNGRGKLSITQLYLQKYS